MNPALPTAVRRAARTARWLTAAALAALAALAATTAQAQAAAESPLAAQARADVRLVATPLPPPQPIPLNTANWSPDTRFGARPPAWYTDGSGVVHLQGAVDLTSQSGIPYLIGTLPPAAWPAHYQTFLVHTYLGTYAEVSVSEAGLINIYNEPAPAVNDWSFVSLEGIGYLPSGAGNPIPLNTQNWTPAPGIQPPGWYKDGSGIVHLQGEISQVSTSGPNPGLIGTLPAAIRPAHAVFTVVSTAGGYADLALEPDGTLGLIDPRPPAVLDYSSVALGAFTYKPAGQGSPIPLNTANWSGNARFRSRAPAWYADGSGIIHLQGAVTQASAAGAGANLIGTLPKAARPGHTVYTIVHTYLGTYADLAIEPNGRLALIGPRPPMVKDYSFVSLESITYRR